MVTSEDEREIELHAPAIEKFARDFYRRLDFAHQESHGERVVAHAVEFCAGEGGCRSVVIAGAWLHQFHNNVDELVAGLKGLGLSDSARATLEEIVRVCRPQKISSAASLEARIVFDADAFEVIGPFGTVRELLCNFHHRKLSWERAVDACQQVQTLFTEKLQTPTARACAADLIAATATFWSHYLPNSQRRCAAVR